MMWLPSHRNRKPLTSSVSVPLIFLFILDFLTLGGVSGGTRPLDIAMMNSSLLRWTMCACSMILRRGVRRYSRFTICDKISVHSSSSVCWNRNHTIYVFNKKHQVSKLFSSVHDNSPFFMIGNFYRMFSFIFFSWLYFLKYTLNQYNLGHNMCVFLWCYKLSSLLPLLVFQSQNLPWSLLVLVSAIATISIWEITMKFNVGIASQTPHIFKVQFNVKSRSCLKSSYMSY